MIAEAVMCLALNVYHEARGESFEGQKAVAHVTLNRAKARNMRVCDVVFEYKQFSWTMKDPIVRDEKAWTMALMVAKKVARRTIDPTQGATHYHATYVSPKWAWSMVKTSQIGKHLFYVDRTYVTVASR